MAKPRGAAPPAKRRCAIYTRKSTEEGLEQDFNSLDAQREACAAYILSQRHEGWTLVPDAYDDGGFSGGTMERPGLKRLLADVAAGRVDIIVVYKVDRLTRALSDFARIVDVLDEGQASFVSVTQAFNTTTSMGRLTLNVLLSFAQFEREVTGERIRDKIAASKAKGMWMGGTVPLGYRVEERKLVIVESEAATIRSIYARYLELGSARALQVELDRTGVRSRSGKSISRGALYAMLQNRLYAGDVVHKGSVYPGQHEAIVDRAIFDEVRRRLADGAAERGTGTNGTEPSLLAGLLCDTHGRAMSPTHASKAGRRYRYYVSQTDGAAADMPAWRVGAIEVERIVCGTVADALRDHRVSYLATRELASSEIERVQVAVGRATDILAGASGPELRALLLGIVRLIVLAQEAVTIICELGHLDDLLAGASLELAAPLPLGCVRTRRRERMLIAANDTSDADPATVRLLARAFAARKVLLESSSIDAAATTLGFSRDYVVALARLSYLAPDIVIAILDGGIGGSTSEGPLIRARLPLGWDGQRAMLMPG